MLDEMKNHHAKSYFEIHYESEVSDRTWYRIKRTLREAGLAINRENLQLVASLKKRGEYTKLSLGQIIYCCQQAQEIAKQRVQVDGDVVYQELQRLSGFKPHRTTIIRWFQSVSRVDGKYFDRKRQYKAEELVEVFAYAFMYQTRKSTQKARKQ